MINDYLTVKMCYTSNFVLFNQQLFSYCISNGLHTTIMLSNEFMWLGSLKETWDHYLISKPFNIYIIQYQFNILNPLSYLISRIKITNYLYHMIPSQTLWRTCVVLDWNFPWGGAINIQIGVNIDSLYNIVTD